MPLYKLDLNSVEVVSVERFYGELSSVRRFSKSLV